MATAVDPAVVEGLRKELDFIKRLSDTAKTVDAYVAAARAAVKIAGKAAAQLPGGNAASSGGDAVITVRGLPDTWNWIKVKDLLQGMGAKNVRVEKPTAWTVAVVRLSDASQKDMLLEKIGAATVEGGALTCEVGEPGVDERQALLGIDRSAAKRKAGEHGAKDAGAKAARTHERLQVLAGATVPPKSVCDVVCAWWQVPYGEQLMRKTAVVEGALQGARKEILRRCRAANAPPVELPAKVGGIIRSPVIERYRNKSELTVGLGVDAQQAEVGFLISSDPTSKSKRKD